MNPTSPPEPSRLDYIDWMRGLACILMIQDHCYDSWLSPEARAGLFFRFSQGISTLAAPIFIFLSGVSFALVTERMLKQGVPNAQIFRTGFVRGLQILGLGFLLRIQEFLLGYPIAPWTDLLRVDVLNILGISIMLMSVIRYFFAPPASPKQSSALKTPQSTGSAQWRVRTVASLVTLAAVVALVTPPLWTTHRPRFLPWMLESYVNGVHVYNAPTPWLFCIFPWSAFAFLGLAFGLFLFTDFAVGQTGRALACVAGVGFVGAALSLWWDYSRIHLYAVYDYWHSSPNFFLLRCGVLLIVLFAVYAWCRWGFGTKGFSPFIQLGRTSLLVYWIHIEFVYGRLSLLPKSQTSIPLATLGMLLVCLAMLGVSIWRTNYKTRARMKIPAVTPQRLPQAM